MLMLCWDEYRCLFSVTRHLESPKTRDFQGTAGTEKRHRYCRAQVAYASVGWTCLVHPAFPGGPYGGRFRCSESTGSSSYSSSGVRDELLLRGPYPAQSSSRLFITPPRKFGRMGSFEEHAPPRYEFPLRTPERFNRDLRAWAMRFGLPTNRSDEEQLPALTIRTSRNQSERVFCFLGPA